MNAANLKLAIILGCAPMLLFTTSGIAIATPVMVVTCSAPTGINIASDIDRDRPKEAVEDAGVYDPKANAYVSHPRHTGSETITINGDGTATETIVEENESAIVITLHVIGTINSGVFSLTDEGSNGYIDSITLYRNDARGIFVGTSYFGWKKPIPIGYIYVSKCKFSNVIR